MADRGDDAAEDIGLAQENDALGQQLVNRVAGGDDDLDLRKFGQHDFRKADAVNRTGQRDIGEDKAERARGADLGKRDIGVFGLDHRKAGMAERIGGEAAEMRVVIDDK